LILTRPEDEIHIQKGKWTTISVTRTLIQKYPYPYSDCVNTNDPFTLEQMKLKSSLFNFTLNNSYTNTYRQQDCVDLCLQRKIESTCKCTHPKYFQMNMSLGVCSTLADLECILEQKENSIHREDLNCFTDCPMECDSFVYDIEYSCSDYLTEEYSKLFTSRNASRKNNDLAFNIFYPYTKYTRITEVPKVTLYDLFSNLGGSMGIFVGFTIFSFIDLLEVFLKIVFVYLR